MTKVICPNCHDANSCGDYEGPTCEVCHGYGYVASDESPYDLPFHQETMDDLSALTIRKTG